MNIRGHGLYFHARPCTVSEPITPITTFVVRMDGKLLHRIGNQPCRGYHVYEWGEIMGQILQYQQENDNIHDPYAVAVMNEQL